jgi:hypothetical protein
MLESVKRVTPRKSASRTMSKLRRSPTNSSASARTRVIVLNLLELHEPRMWNGVQLYSSRCALIGANGSAITKVFPPYRFVLVMVPLPLNRRRKPAYQSMVSPY